MTGYFLNVTPRLCSRDAFPGTIMGTGIRTWSGISRFRTMSVLVTHFRYYSQPNQHNYHASMCQRIYSSNFQPNTPTRCCPDCQLSGRSTIDMTPVIDLSNANFGLVPLGSIDAIDMLKNEYFQFVYFLFAVNTRGRTYRKMTGFVHTNTRLS